MEWQWGVWRNLADPVIAGTFFPRRTCGGCWPPGWYWATSRLKNQSIRPYLSSLWGQRNMLYTSSAYQLHQGPPSWNWAGFRPLHIFSRRHLPLCHETTNSKTSRPQTEKSTSLASNSSNNPHDVGFHYHPSLQDGCYTSRWQQEDLR